MPSPITSPISPPVVSAEAFKPNHASLLFAPLAAAVFLLSPVPAHLPIPYQATCGATLLLTILFTTLTHLAELHEGKHLPPTMTPPTLSDITKETPSTHIWREKDGKSVYVPKLYARKTTVPGGLKAFTMSQVAKHNTKTDCYVVIESQVYDISKYVMLHPGGWLPLQNMAGKDATDAFANYHPASVYKSILPGFHVGWVTDGLDGTGFVVAAREIRQSLLRRGLFETNSYYYHTKIFAWLLPLFLTSLLLTALPQTYPPKLIGAVGMALFWQQLAFVGHDVGHNSISHKKWKDTFLGVLFGNSFGGISLGWWKRSHNVHHVVCNSVEHDPDIQHMPLFAVSDEVFDLGKLNVAGVGEKEGGFWSTYHEKVVRSDVVSRFLVSNQHWLFYPIMGVARFNLYAQGWLFALNAQKQDPWYASHFQKLEFATLSVFLTWLCCLVGTLATWKERIGWLLVSHGLAGVLHVQICVSHFPMPVYHGHAYNGLEDEWFRMQCMTTMNVVCPRWLDWVHGGLQFQIEHHLFPRLPRHNLREARDLVKPFCEKFDVPYHEAGFVAANCEMVRGLWEVAGKCRREGLGGVGGLKETQLYAGLHAEG